MKTIRKDVFETNSSSVHTLVVKHRDSNNIPVSKTGKMRVKLGYFGKDFSTDFDQETKLSYVLTVTMVKLKMFDEGRTYFKEQVEALRDNYIYDRILEDLKEHVPELKEIVPLYSPGWGLDHQMQNNIEWDIYEFLHMSVADFVYCDDIGLHTDCD